MPLALVFGPCFRARPFVLVNVDNPPAENGTRRFRGKRRRDSRASSGLVGVSDRCTLTSMWTRDSQLQTMRRTLHGFVFSRITILSGKGWRSSLYVPNSGEHATMPLPCSSKLSWPAKGQEGLPEEILSPPFPGSWMDGWM